MTGGKDDSDAVRDDYVEEVRFDYTIPGRLVGGKRYHLSRFLHAPSARDLIRGKRGGGLTSGRRIDRGLNSAI